MNYQVTVEFKSENVDKNGNAKVIKYKYMVDAESTFEAEKRIAGYLHDSTQDYEVVGVVKANIEGIVHPKTTPHVYETN